ncbi:WhiB family transcriptional regulator [Streptomyces griseoaurantiacus]|uniref:Transcriptional regulator WhiB n=1 Tax=Streptomyces griseoaurantiacus TaxID=68213 RepID=A0A7W2HWS5_9ACTN|nr:MULTISPECIES: WhiB family transcriptional regulator [Streptomyces]MBA5224542.1 WhiB family transcriptional regulator [Streptomyces griseoaurantiacus]
MHRTTAAPARHRLRGDQAWQSKAACRSTERHPVDLETFFPGPDDTQTIATAKAYCGACPVRAVCLDAALETGDAHGIRGGLTEEERAPLHEKTQTRLDPTRVAEAVAGRDVHLSKPERRAVATAALQQGLSEERLARILQITLEHAQKLYRAARRAERHRALHQQQNTTAPDAQGDIRTFGTAA